MDKPPLLLVVAAYEQDARRWIDRFGAGRQCRSVRELRHAQGMPRGVEYVVTERFAQEEKTRRALEYLRDVVGGRDVGSEIS